MNHRVTESEHALLKKIVFKRMHDLKDRVHTAGNFALLLFGDEIAETDALFEKLFGRHAANICRAEWKKIADIGADAYSDDLAARGFC